MSEKQEIALRTLVHELGCDWGLTIEQEADIEERIRKILEIPFEGSDVP